MKTTPRKQRPKCKLTLCQRDGSWTCRVCAAALCENHCSLKLPDGTALCSQCKKPPFGIRTAS